eukprot:11105768-Ditylum_brightwellii.AAC.1
MDHHLLEHHQCHFSQASPTPFASNPLNELIEFAADGLLARELNQGTADIAKLPVDQYTKNLLEELQ